MKIEIVTPRLVLRPLGVGDLETVMAYSMDPENTRYMRFLPFADEAETLDFLRETEAEWGKAEPRYFEFAVLHGGRHIGGVSLYHEDFGAELGWILAREAWGRGFAFEAAEAMTDWFFRNRGASHFVAHCDTANTPSWRLMEKLGMFRTGEHGGRRNRIAAEDSFEYRYDLYLRLGPDGSIQRLPAPEPGGEGEA